MISRDREKGSADYNSCCIYILVCAIRVRCRVLFELEGLHRSAERIQPPIIITMIYPRSRLACGQTNKKRKRPNIEFLKLFCCCCLWRPWPPPSLLHRLYNMNYFTIIQDFIRRNFCWLEYRSRSTAASLLGGRRAGRSSQYRHYWMKPQYNLGSYK